MLNARTPIQPEPPVRDAFISRLLSLPFDQFERYLCRLLAALGYADPTLLGRHYFKGGREGGGADLLLTISTGVTTVPVLVLAKQFSRPLQKRYLYELRGVMVSRGISRGLVVTTGTFRPGTIAAAHEGKGVDIDLIDGTLLARLALNHRLGITELKVPAFALDEPFFANLANDNRSTV